MSENYNQKDLMNYLITKIDNIDEKLDKVDSSYTEVKTMLRNYNNLWGKVETAYQKINSVEKRLIKIENTDEVKEKFTNINWTKIMGATSIGMFVIAIIAIFIK